MKTGVKVIMANDIEYKTEGEIIRNRKIIVYYFFYLNWNQSFTGCIVSNASTGAQKKVQPKY